MIFSEIIRIREMQNIGSDTGRPTVYSIHVNVCIILLVFFMLILHLCMFKIMILFSRLLLKHYLFMSDSHCYQSNI